MIPGEFLVDLRIQGTGFEVRHKSDDPAVDGCSIGTNISSDRELLVDIVVVVKGQSDLLEVVLRLRPPCILSGFQHELDDHCGQQGRIQGKWQSSMMHTWAIPENGC